MKVINSLDTSWKTWEEAQNTEVMRNTQNTVRKDRSNFKEIGWNGCQIGA
jgi:hypothetical protein